MSATITQDYHGELVPAFGRDYKNKKAVEADFRSGKDFILCTPRSDTYCSIRDFAPGVRVILRYAKQMKLTEVTV